MINLKLQNMKQAAYFDYFKSFSLNASDTIKKLQVQFKEEIQQSFFFDSSMMFKRIKTLLGSYQILIYQINDSCEFVEIPQFGNCILKIFLQIMSVIRFLLHKILEKSNKKQDPSPLIDRTNSFQKTHMHMTHTNLSHSPSLHQQNRLMYKKKQQSKYIINTLNQQLSLLQLEQSQNLQASKKQFRSLIQGKQKLQSIEISQNQKILSEALNSFCKKGQHLKTFVNLRQAAMISNMKQGVGQYMKVKDILDEDSNTKLSNASIKLQQLFKTHTINYLKQKQSQMVSRQVQAHFQQPLYNRILQENKHIKKLNDVIRKLNDEIGFEQQKSYSLETLLKKKNQQFELRAMEFRIAKIQMDNLKSKHQKIFEAELNLINSKHQLCTNCHNKISPSSGQKKSQIDCISKSIIQASDQNEQINTQQSQRNSDSANNNPSRLIQKMNRRVNYKNGSSATRKNLEFKQIDTKSDQLELQSLTWYMKIQPQISIQKKKQFQNKKLTIVQRVASSNVNMNNTFSTYRDQKKRKTKMLTSQSRNQFQIQRVFMFSNYNELRIAANNSEQKLIGIKGLHKKNTQGSCSDNQFTTTNQATQKCLNNDTINENKLVSAQDQLTKHPTFHRNNYHTQIVQSRQSRQRQNSNQNKFSNIHLLQKGKENIKIIDDTTKGMSDKYHQQSLLKKTLAQSYKNFQPNNQQNVEKQQDQLCNEASRISLNHNAQKFPKFIKFSSQQKITLSTKDLINLFFDIQTAKNFQYINLFQNDQLKVSTAVKDIRKTNQALSANIKQMQKKNFINGLITRVKGEVASRTMNMTSTQGMQPSKTQKNNVISECPSMNCTFSGTLIKTKFWNQLSVQKTSNHQNQIHQILKCYNSQSLIAMLFKQLRDLKRTTFSTSHQMTNYQIVRNFLRYPFSAITLQNDKKFLQKQRQQSVVEYLQLRKIMHRVFKLHKNCKISECKNSFEKFGMKQFSNGQRHYVDGGESQNVLCWHLVQFFELVGIILIPRINNGDSSQN